MTAAANPSAIEPGRTPAAAKSKGTSTPRCRPGRAAPRNPPLPHDRRRESLRYRTRPHTRRREIQGHEHTTLPARPRCSSSEFEI
jgi:hypothetical protein